MTTQLTITGMHCASCKTLIESVLQDIPGVTDCTVDFATGNATIAHDVTVTIDQLKREIESLGSYHVEAQV